MNIRAIFQRMNVKDYSRIALLMIVFITLVIVFFYLDRSNTLSNAIQSWGIWGAFLALFLMIMVCMIPVPSEGLLIVCMKVYGVYTGVLLGWVGSMISALIIFYISRYHGQKFMRRIVTQESFESVDNWVKHKGTLGLIIARLLPIPAFVANYIAGAIPSISLGSYIWTAAVTIIPYYLGTALVFVGIAQATWLWLIIGAIAIIAFWMAGYRLKRHELKKE